MFSADYALNYTGKRNVTPSSFYPDPKIKEGINSDIFMIEAKNSSGKSTLLDLIALGLRVDPLDSTYKKMYSISSSLEDRLFKFSNRTDYELTFNIRMINSFQNGLVLQKKHPKSKDIEIYEVNGGVQSSINLPPNKFFEKYFFIYNTPDLPTKRLPELIDEIDREQSNYRKKLESLQRFFNDTLQDIKKSDNFEQKEKLEARLGQLSDEKNQLIQESEKLKEKFCILNKYYHIRAIDYYSYLCDDFERRIKKIETEEQGIKRTQKTISTKHDNSFTALETTLNEMQQNVDKLSPHLYSLFGTKNSYFIYFDNLDLLTVLDKLDFDSKFFKNVSDLQNKLKVHESNFNSANFKSKAEFYHSLLELLKNSNFFEDVLPGTELKIKELCQSIQGEYDKYSKQLNEFNDVKTASDLLSSLSTKSTDASSQLKHYKVWVAKKENTSQTDILPDRSSELNKLQADYKKAESILSDLLGSAELNNISLDRVAEGDDSEIKEIEFQFPEYAEYYILGRSIQDGQLGSKLMTLSKNLLDFEQNIIRNVARYEDTNREYSSLLDQKPHKYQGCSQQIKDMENSVIDLLRKFSSYENILLSLKPNRLSSEKISNAVSKSEGFDEYYSGISKYLATKISSFNYINDFVTPVEVDLINRKILIADGTEIFFDDISTGQAMSMYMRGLLNRSSEDSRKIIAIFDEISTLDQRSLGAVIDCLKELKKEGRLLLSIFVQRGEEGSYNIIKYE